MYFIVLLLFLFSKVLSIQMLETMKDVQTEASKIVTSLQEELERIRKQSLLDQRKMQEESERVLADLKLRLEQATRELAIKAEQEKVIIKKGNYPFLCTFSQFHSHVFIAVCLYIPYDEWTNSFFFKYIS